jgi:excisionase family DNA binding protein
MHNPVSATTSHPQPASPNTTPLALSVEIAALRLGLSETSVRLAIKSGELPAVRIGRRLLIPQAGLDRLLNVMG